MTYVTWKIVRIPFSESTNTWDTASSTVLSDYFDPIVRVNTGDARDSFQFKVTNFNDTYDNYFQPQDKIEIYRVVNSDTTASSDLLMIGAIQQVPNSLTSNMNMYRVEGYNFSEAVLSGITFVDVTSRTIPQAFQDALNQVQTYNSNFTVTWASGNPSVKTGGGAFPNIGEKWFNKPLRQLFEKWSTQQATEDVRYYWYVDKNNELVWLPSEQSPDYQFNSESDNLRSLKIGKDVSDVKNWVIAKGGLDPDGKAIQARADDLSSIAKHGLRYYIITSIAKNAGTLVDDDKVSAGVTDMKDATYPFTVTWGDQDSFASYSAYVTGLREYVKAQCKLEAEAFIETRAFGRLLIDLEFEPGQVDWGLGDLVECTIPELTKEGVLTPVKSLRVKDIQYSTTGDVYSLEEDYGTV